LGFESLPRSLKNPLENGGSKERTSASTSAGKVPTLRRGKRDQYELTPPEAKFYDALVETGLTFSVQPWTQHVETTFRPDFFVHYAGRVVVVEIDGHEWHKTKEQRGRDAVKTRFFAARGIRVVPFTGSQVWKDAAACVRELHDVLRESHARP
jgi:very-short-patch-repair endonuclease